VITINRPVVANAIADAFRRFESDDEVRVAVSTGERSVLHRYRSRPVNVSADIGTFVPRFARAGR
jgi:hypothetical protein